MLKLTLLKFRRQNWFGRMTLGLVVAGALLLGAEGLHVHAAEKSALQVQSTIPKGVPMSTPDDAAGAPSKMDPRLEGQRERIWKDDRRKRLVADTDKLLQLATELKVDVDKSSPNELSVTVIEKATEMEKLSHDVKERMRN
jgi:hypothetical protein